ncbi:MAG: mechanosensitive ion channel domain-containing protein [Pseudomonadota bacterium]
MKFGTVIVGARALTASLILIGGLAAAPALAQQAIDGSSDAATDAQTEAAVDTLLDVLKDDEARQRLIERLETGDGATVENGGTPEADDDPPGIAQQIAEFTKDASETVYTNVTRLWTEFSGARVLLNGIPENRLERLRNNALPLLATIVTTLAILIGLTMAFSRILRRRAPRQKRTTIVQAVISVALSAVSDLTVLAVAYAAGYALSLTVFGTSGVISVEQSLYLNAFLIAGVGRIFIRLFVLPDRPEHAVFSFDADVQRIIHNRLVTIFYLLSYGITAAVPIANLWSSFLVGRSVRIVVLTLGAILALLAIRRISSTLRTLRKEQADRTEVHASATSSVGEVLEDAGSEIVDQSATFVERSWPIFATIYILSCYVIAIAEPSLMIDLIGTATLQTIVAIGAIALAIRALKYSSAATFPLPQAIARNFSELKERLDGFVPVLIRVAAIMLILCGGAFLIDAWHLYDVEAWLALPGSAEFLWRVVGAALIVLTTVIVWAVISAWIDRKLKLDLPGRNVSARSRTLLALFKNAFTIAVLVFGTMMALSELGINIAPLLAGAGVIGLAVGFGSQSLVQDIITGVFIQLENAINEGDVISVGGFTGTVEKLTIRSVGIRDLEGVYHIVPFSAVSTVSNYMRKFAFHVAEFGVAYGAPIAAVKEAMTDAFAELKEMPDYRRDVLGDLEMHGVTSLGDSAVVVRARIRTKPGKQWAIGRAYTEIVKTLFDERGIEIPYPHRQLVYPPSRNSEEKTGPGSEPVAVAVDG